MIPTLIVSIFGMNVPNFMENRLWALPMIMLVAVALSFLGVFLFRKRNWF
jgi:magnesium transporter